MIQRRISDKTPRRLLFLFELLSLILIFIYEGERPDRYTLATGIGLVLVVYLSNYILLKLSSGDNYIFLIATMLMSIGIIMIYRLDPLLGVRQLVWISLGIGCFYLTYFIIKYIKYWDSLIYLYVGISYLLFVLTLVLGEETHGSINWISIKGYSFQPAEITKLLLIFILAAFYSNYNKFRKIKYASYYLTAIVYSFIGLLFLQRELGMSVIFYAIFMALLFIYEKDRKLLLYNIGLLIIFSVLGYFLFNHVKIRIETWLDPWAYIDGKGYQITQSLFAISEGGFFGTGLGLGHPHFIPLAYNDFIFPAIVEEMGIFAGIGIIMLFMILVYRGFKIAIEQDRKFYKILALGISILFGVQSIIILGGVLKLIPLTGITLPFIAYGGTSIISSFIALGILQVASEDLDWKVAKNE